MKKKIILNLLVIFYTTNVFSQATATMTVSPGTTVCDNELVTFTVAISGCSSTYTVDWIRNGLTMSTCSNPCTTWTSMLPSGNWPYWCVVHCITQGNPASNLINMIVDPCSGIEELLNESLSTVYPNPATDSFLIEFVPQGRTRYSLNVFDSAGKYLKTDFKMAYNTVAFSARQFSAGLYYYELRGENGKQFSAGKFVVSR